MPRHAATEEQTTVDTEAPTLFLFLGKQTSVSQLPFRRYKTARRTLHPKSNLLVLSLLQMAISTNPTISFCMAVVLVIFSFVNGATHHHLAPAPAPIVAECSALMMNMADCLSYVSSGSGVMKPEKSCCAGLKTVLRTRAECLCEGLKSSSQMGIVLNVTKAAMLPAACSLSAPSVSNCDLNVVNGAAPVAAPNSVPGLLPDQIAPTQGGNSGIKMYPATLVSFICGLFVFLIVSTV